MDIVQTLHMVITFHSQGRLKEAQELCLQILAVEPDQPDATHFLGVIAYAGKEYESAKKYISRAMKLMPDNPGCHTNMGNVYKQEKKYANALESYEKALTLDPLNQKALNNIGATCLKLGKFERARQSLTRAIEIEPGYAQAHNNLGEVLRQTGQYEYAIASFETAASLAPKFIAPRWNRANCMMLLGKFPQAWQEYEYRWQRSKTPKRMIDAGERWKGQPFHGKTLFIYEEQGMGDTIQFVRFLPLVKSLGGHVIFEVIPPLLRLMLTAKGYDRLWVGIKDVDTRPTDRFDYHIPLMSIPEILQTTLDTIPNDFPYLHCNKNLKTAWDRRIGGGTCFKVGIVWAGHCEHSNDDFRSVPLSCFKTLKDINNIRLVSLQKEKYKKWTDVDPDTLFDQDPGAEIFDFADTAAIIENLDLIISIDTAVVHLAGAMGKEVWTLLPFSPDWRWMTDRTDSPWYPSMSLFRQSEPGDWGSVFKRVKIKLEKKLSIPTDS